MTQLPLAQAGRLVRMFLQLRASFEAQQMDSWTEFCAAASVVVCAVFWLMCIS